MSQWVERRNRERASLRWTVRLKKLPHGPVVEAVTTNLSVGGFRCISPQAFEPGDDVDCVFAPPNGLGSGTWVLQCRAHVLRVSETDSQSAWAVASQFREYAVLATNGARPAPCQAESPE